MSERDRAITAGLTPEEADAWILAGRLASAFFSLPKLHSSDGEEVARAIHVIQDKLLARPAYRRYLEIER